MTAHRDVGVQAGTSTAQDPDQQVGIIIVHHQTPELLQRCLRQLSAQTAAFPVTTLVVDNASPGMAVRELVAAFPEVQFILNPDNVGFARACNQGMRAVTAPFCLLLNPDALPDAEALDWLVQLMRDYPRAGVVAPRLLNPDGSLQYSCRRFPTARVLFIRAARLDRLFRRTVDRYLMRDWDHGVQRPVDWAIGACLLLRRAALDDVGWLDERFFLYYEDLDLCHRMWQRGWDVRYEPAATVRHEHQRGSAARWLNRLAWVHACSLVRLLRKHRLGWW